MKRDGGNTVWIVMIIATAQRAVSMTCVCRYCRHNRKWEVHLCLLASVAIERLVFKRLHMSFWIWWRQTFSVSALQEYLVIIQVSVLFSDLWFLFQCRMLKIGGGGW